MSKKEPGKTGNEQTVHRVKITPQKGLKVLDEMGNVIPQKGIKAVFSTFYSRLEKSGDVTITNKKGA